MIKSCREAFFLVSDVADFSVGHVLKGIETKSVKILLENFDLTSAVIGFANCVGYSHPILNGIGRACKTGKDVIRVFSLPQSFVNLTGLIESHQLTAFNVSELFRKLVQNIVALFTVAGIQELSMLGCSLPSFYKNMLSVTEFTSGLTGLFPPLPVPVRLPSQRNQVSPTSPRVSALNHYSQTWEKAMKISLFSIATIGVMSFIPAAVTSGALGALGSLSLGGLSINSVLVFGSSILNSSFTVPTLLLIGRVSNLFNSYTKKYIDKEREIEGKRKDFNTALAEGLQDVVGLKLSIESSQKQTPPELDRVSLVYFHKKLDSLLSKIDEQKKDQGSQFRYSSVRDPLSALVQGLARLLDGVNLCQAARQGSLLREIEAVESALKGVTSRPLT